MPSKAILIVAATMCLFAVSTVQARELFLEPYPMKCTEDKVLTYVSYTIFDNKANAVILENDNSLIVRSLVCLNKEPLSQLKVKELEKTIRTKLNVQSVTLLSTIPLRE